MRALLSMIEPGSFERLQASLRPASRIVFIVNVLFFAAFYALDAYDLWQGWQTGQWDTFWISAISAPLPILFLAQPFRPITSLKQAEHTAQMLRRAATSVDERLAPVAMSQSEPQDAAAAQSDMIPFGPLRPIGTPLAPTLNIVMALCMPFFLAIGVFQLQFLNYAFEHDLPSSLTFLPGVAVFVIIVLIIILVWVFHRRRAPSHLTVTADTLGLSWSDRQGVRRLPWSAVRSFFQVSETGSAAAFSRMAYIVDGGETLLVWAGASVARVAAGKHDATERLAQLIMARTGQPLRDLSSVASMLEMTDGSPLRLRALGVPTNALGIGEQPLVAARSDRRRHWARTAALLAMPTLLVGLLYGTGIWLQRYQPEYYAALPTRLHAEQPLFQDALSADTGAWTPANPAPGAGQRYAYANGAYQLSTTSSDTAIGAGAPGIYGDAAVEVMAGQTGSADNDGVGLMVRASDSADSMLVFAVDNAGNWVFSEYHIVGGSGRSSPIDDGHSAYANTGDGAANRLLLLMRGSSYLYYINDHLVGSFTDDFFPTPHKGHAGVFVLSGATQGAFTDFAIYPVQPQSSFFYA